MNALKKNWKWLTSVAILPVLFYAGHQYAKIKHEKILLDFRSQGLNENVFVEEFANETEYEAFMEHLDVYDLYTEVSAALTEAREEYNNLHVNTKGE